jgi:hypothetical protein
MSSLTFASGNGVTSQMNVNIVDQERSWDLFWPTLQRSDGSYIGTAGWGNQTYVVALDTSRNPLWSSSIGNGFSFLPRPRGPDGNVLKRLRGFILLRSDCHWEIGALLLSFWER